MTGTSVGGITATGGAAVVVGGAGGDSSRRGGDFAGCFDTGLGCESRTTFGGFGSCVCRYVTRSG